MNERPCAQAVRARAQTTPWLFAFQVFRAMQWTAFALPVIRMLKGHPWETGLMVGLLFAMGSSQLLLPNPFMPEAVARVHLVETATSNFLFGFTLVWILLRLGPTRIAS